ncbi:MAG TPA: DUF87 domain-containing protein [Candidatus Dormibacteraeota bacterium]
MAGLFGRTAGRLKLPLAVGPLVVRRRPAGGLAEAPPALAILATGPLGYSGAAEEDQQRWCDAFRRLLDGLDHPLQIIVRSRPGIERARTSSQFAHGDRRTLDLAFTLALDEAAAAMHRTVSFVAPPAAAEGLITALSAVEVTVEPAVATPPPDYRVELGQRLETAGGLRRSWYLQRFPGIELEPGWLQRFAVPAVDVLIACHLLPLPTAWIVDHLQRRLTAMRAARLEESASGDSDPHLAGALPTAQELQRQLVASQERAFLVAVYVTASAADDAALAAASEAIESAARSLLCRLEPLTFRMYDGSLATAPRGGDPLNRGKILHTSAAATLFPWFDSELREPDGLLVGRSRATGTPVQLDPFDQRRHPNANIGVFGHSGAGKTYLMSTLAMSAASLGIQVLIIDPEHEYGGLARALGGVDLPLALGSGVALNVLQLRGEQSADESWLGPAAADAVDLISVLCGGLDEAQRAGVEAAVRRAYAEVEQPLLRDVAAQLAADSQPGRVLSRWVEGSLGLLFSRPTNVDLEAPVVVFGMRELREEMIALVHFLLAEALWTRIKARRRRRLLFVDELGLLFEDPTIRKFVVNLARRIRKYDGGLVFATQNPGDLLSSEPGSVVATNPAIHFFGSLRPGEAARVQRAFQLSDAQRAGLETARRGEFLLASGSDRVPIEVVAPPWQAELIGQVRAPPGPAV